MNTDLECPHCRHRFSANADSAGAPIICPSCSSPVPNPPPQAGPPPAVLFCPKCGQQNRQNDYACSRCGFPLHAESRSQPRYVAADDAGLGGLIPYRNAQALWAYYLAIFSLIPCLGAPLGIAALVLGIRGLTAARLRPEARGRTHAWIGIILGGLCGIGYTVLVLIGAVTYFAAKH